MNVLKSTKRTAVYFLVRLLSRLLNRLPRRSAITLGGWLGLAAWGLAPRDQHRAVRHLTLVYGGQLTHRQKLQIGRDFFVNSGRNMADVLRFRRHFGTELRALVQVEGLEYFDIAYRRGKGVIGVTGHIGNFELLAAYIASLGYEVAVIGRELYDPRLDRLLSANREAVGLVNIATTESPKIILGWLRQGRALGVLIDTDSHRVRGQFVPAFGRWSYTPVGQSVLGLRTGAAFVPMACVRTPDNRYRLIIQPPVEIKPSGDFEADVYNMTLKCTQALEEFIRAYPDQWPWQHNRWRTRKIPAA
ncbi:MAG: lysophospholipid acyltransferase family protein [Candidatus Zixiibacteriota bacterium]